MTIPSARRTQRRVFDEGLVISNFSIGECQEFEMQECSAILCEAIMGEGHVLPNNSEDTYPSFPITTNK